MPKLVALDVADHAAVIRFCREKSIGLVVVGPEAPLVAGLADDLNAAGLKVFGPSKEAARLEGSKGYTKDLCAEASIPTARYRRFTDAAAARAYVSAQGAPIVVKADGLAAGKGVTVAATVAEAHAAIDACFSGALGAAGAEVVVEECLVGEEASFFALVDGTHVLALATAQDHKRVLDGDEGSQHRRHGRLFAGARHDARIGRPHHEGDHSPDGRRHGARAARRSRACSSPG